MEKDIIMCDKEKKPKINVILPTYNGEKYLRRQIESIINQTYPNIDIYIRDDKSTDNTVKEILNLIEEYGKLRNIYLIKDDMGNLNVPKSFYQILRECRVAEYYALCDQDDEWLPNKVEWAVEMLEKENGEVPIVYCSRSAYYTATGQYLRSYTKQKIIDLNHTLFYTPASGFTQIFNEQARKQFLLSVNPGEEMHDRYLLRCAVCFGKLLYDERITALHIRHEEAVTNHDSSNRNLLVNFILNEIMGDNQKEIKKNLEYFYEIFETKMDINQKKILKLFISPCNLKNQIQKFFYPHRLRSSIQGEFALRILFMLGNI